jgi:hypothetical protein
MKGAATNPVAGLFAFMPRRARMHARKHDSFLNPFGVNAGSPNPANASRLTAPGQVSRGTRRPCAAVCHGRKRKISGRRQLNASPGVGPLRVVGCGVFDTYHPHHLLASPVLLSLAVSPLAAVIVRFPSLPLPALSRETAPCSAALLFRFPISLPASLRACAWFCYPVVQPS